MSLFNRVTIIGLGLIGGSLGLAIKDKRLAREVVGVSRRHSTIRRAVSLGAVDAATQDFKKGIKGSELIVICAPVLKIIDIARRIKPYLEKGTIVTDAGSTKSEIVRNIEPIFPDGIDFIGSHPIAGSEKSGVQYADKDLFKGAYCILTRSTHTNPKALVKIRRFWTALGMKIKIMGPGEHDKVLSRLSHLPHASSVALSNAVGGQELRLAGGGLKDATRIASSSSELWRDIFITNKSNIIRDIDVFKKELSRIELALKKNNNKELLRLLEKAKVIRDSVK